MSALWSEAFGKLVLCIIGTSLTLVGGLPVILENKEQINPTADKIIKGVTGMEIGISLSALFTTGACYYNEH